MSKHTATVIFPGRSDPIGITIQPSGSSFRLSWSADGRRKHGQTEALQGAADALTGEVIDFPNDYCLGQWAVHVCGEAKRWRLADFVLGLGIDRIGPQRASEIATAMGSWERLEQALSQLQVVDLPASREDMEHLELEAAIEEETVEVTRVPARVSTGGVELAFDATVAVCDGKTQLPDLYPQPLQTLIDATGPTFGAS